MSADVGVRERQRTCDKAPLLPCHVSIPHHFHFRITSTSASLPWPLAAIRMHQHLLRPRSLPPCCSLLPGLLPSSHPSLLPPLPPSLLPSLLPSSPLATHPCCPGSYNRRHNGNHNLRRQRQQPTRAGRAYLEQEPPAQQQRAFLRLDSKRADDLDASCGRATAGNGSTSSIDPHPYTGARMSACRDSREIPGSWSLLCTC